MQAAAHGIGFHAEADQVRGVEVVEGLLAGQRHSSILEVYGLRVRYRTSGRGNRLQSATAYTAAFTRFFANLR